MYEHRLQLDSLYFSRSAISAHGFPGSGDFSNSYTDTCASQPTNRCEGASNREYSYIPSFMPDATAHTCAERSILTLPYTSVNATYDRPTNVPMIGGSAFNQLDLGLGEPQISEMPSLLGEGGTPIKPSIMNVDAMLQAYSETILQTNWLKEGEHEPPGAYSPFIIEIAQDQYICRICGHPNNRMERALSHCRKHFGHRPFKCTDLHGQRSPDGCGARFFTRECLTAHLKRDTVTCNICDAQVAKKNLKRHLKSQKCLQASGTRYHDTRRNIYAERQ